MPQAPNTSSGNHSDTPFPARAKPNLLHTSYMGSAAGIYLAQQDTWDRVRPYLYLNSISLSWGGATSIKGNQPFHRDQRGLRLVFTETQPSTSQVLSISYAQVLPLLKSQGIPDLYYREVSPLFLMHCCSLYNMSIMNFLALILVSSGSGQTWRCLECDKAVLACQLYSVSKFIFFS